MLLAHCRKLLRVDVSLIAARGERHISAINDKRSLAPKTPSKMDEGRCPSAVQGRRPDRERDRVDPLPVRENRRKRHGGAKLRAKAALLLLPPAAACAGLTTSTETTDPAVILRAPHRSLFKLVSSPDGSLFAGGNEVLYRSQPTDTGSWTAFAFPNHLVIGLYAVSRDRVLAITRDCGLIFEWLSSAGWRVAFDEKESSANGSCDAMHAIWGRSAADIYAVGENGLVVHYDGNRWTEDHGVNQLFDSLAFTQYRRELWTISATTQDLIIGAGGAILRKTNGGSWNLLSPPPDFSPWCGFVTVVGQGDAIAFAYSTCVGRINKTNFSVLNPRLAGFRSDIVFGASEADGTALLWDYSGDVVALRGKELRVYYLRGGIGATGGAVMNEQWLYMAGVIGSDGVVVRVPR